jgi:signal transduction histidine kinase
MAVNAKVKSYRLSLSPTYLALICGLIILLLIIGGFFEINRTEKSLRGILENQGVTILRGLEREIENTVTVIEVMEEVPGGHLLNIASSISFFALEDTIIDHLVEIATMVDQGVAGQPLSTSKLESLAQREGLEAVEVLDQGSQSQVPGKGSSMYGPLLRGTREMLVIPFEKPEPDEGDLFSVAIRRREGKGIVVVSVDHPRMKQLRRKFAIRNVLEAGGFGEGIQYVSIFDRSLSLVAQTGKEGAGDRRDNSLLQLVPGEASRSGFRSLSDGQEVLEVVKTLHLGEEPYGVMQVGLSTQGIRTILSISRRNIILSIGILLGLGIAGVTLIYIEQNRHLRKVGEMEGRIQTAERLLALGKLGAGVAHEIRNPLNAIGMAIQRLGREFQPREEGGERQYQDIIRVIRGEIRRLNQIVEQFVLFSKPYKLDLAPSSPVEILENISVLFAEEARAQSIEIRKEIDPMLPPLMMDKGRITQALINIVTNGIHAMEGGGDLTLKAKMDGRDWIGIMVSDTGRGIPEEEIEKAFDYSYTTKEKGLGLGLPIAHKIIEEHGGRITIESQVRTGTTVSIFLPAKVTAS